MSNSEKTWPATKTGDQKYRGQKARWYPRKTLELSRPTFAGTTYSTLLQHLQYGFQASNRNVKIYISSVLQWGFIRQFSWYGHCFTPFTIISSVACQSSNEIARQVGRQKSARQTWHIKVDISSYPAIGILNISSSLLFSSLNPKLESLKNQST